MNRQQLGADIKRYSCLFILAIINFLFGIKYISRVTDYYVLLSVVIVILLLSLYILNKHIRKYNHFLKVFNWGIILIFIVLSGFVFYKLPVENLNVDRWSIITAFWQSFENGEYVYLAKSNVGNTPGPMPFYYILAYPFYLIGELGFYSVCGLIVFMLLLKYCRIKEYIITSNVLFLIISPFFLWEVICRSNILLNGSFILFSIVYFLREERVNVYRLVISGVLFGLFLSTRSVFVIAYITTCLYAQRAGAITFKQLMQIGLIAVSVLVITFLPFVLNHYPEFLVINPFVIQSTFLMPFYFTFFFVVLSFLLAFFIRCKSDVYYYIGLNLFLCIVTYFAYHIGEIGAKEAIFGRIVDISYFIFCIPFVLLYLSDERESKNRRKFDGLKSID